MPSRQTHTQAGPLCPPWTTLRSPPCSAEAAGGLHPPPTASAQGLSTQSVVSGSQRQVLGWPRPAGSGGPSVNRPGWWPGAQSLSFLPEHWSPSRVHPPCPLAPSWHHPSGRAGAQASKANFLYSLQAKYLQNQGIVWPQVFSGIVGNCVNALANYVLVSVLGQGVRGSAFANTVSQFSQAVFLLFYIVLKKLHLETWAGWSWECLQDWGPFFRLAIPSMLMLCIEWWAYEIGSFLVGLLSVLDLSAQAVIYEVATVIYMIPMGLSIAVCVRVGTALGAADTVQAKRSAISGTLCTVGTSLVVGILLSLLRNKLGHIFTNDEEVVALVNKVLPLYIFFQLFDALCCLYAGVLRGTGRQAFGAVVNAVMYYAIGLPLGVVLTFLVGMGIMGLWLGMLVCVMLATAAFVTYTARMDWKRAAEEAQKHAGLPPLGSTESMAFGTRPGPEKVVVSSVATGSSPGVILMTYSRLGGHLDLLRTPEAVHALPTPAGQLSAKQLALRRGAALAVAVGSLIAGLVLRVLTARP
uniref:Multidrug and toxin extrusion protein n=1 Tax=Capra hircus TaxID=9925 RepID=A0A8C2PKE7_CAPHI